MSAHTPGPWRWMNAHALVADYGPRRAILTTPPIHSDGSLRTRGDDGRLRNLDPNEPNASLMAAAPELLAALRGALDALEYVARVDPTFSGFGVRADRIATANAAIAKAEGR